MPARPEDIIVEDRSRTTFENARECAEILRGRGLAQPLLVTDATHLWRSDLCFRKQGFETIPCGCYYRATSLHPRVIDFVPDLTTLEAIDQIAHEWFGLAWYWLAGKI